MKAKSYDTYTHHNHRENRREGKGQINQEQFYVMMMVLSIIVAFHQEVLEVAVLVATVEILLCEIVVKEFFVVPFTKIGFFPQFVALIEFFHLEMVYFALEGRALRLMTCACLQAVEVHCYTVYLAQVLFGLDAGNVTHKRRVQVWSIGGQFREGNRWGREGVEGTVAITVRAICIYVYIPISCSCCYWKLIQWQGLKEHWTQSLRVGDLHLLMCLSNLQDSMRWFLSNGQQLYCLTEVVSLDVLEVFI